MSGVHLIFDKEREKKNVCFTFYKKEGCCNRLPLLSIALLAVHFWLIPADL